MNTFTTVLLVVALIAVALTVVSVVRPRRQGVDPNAKLRERLDGEALERGGPAGGQRAFNGSCPM